MKRRFVGRVVDEARPGQTGTPPRDSTNPGEDREGPERDHFARAADGLDYLTFSKSMRIVKTRG